MSEQTERYVKLLKKKLDWVVIGILWTILLVLGGIYLMELQADEITAGTGKPAVIEDPVAANKFYQSVQTMSKAAETSRDDLYTSYPTIRQIRQFNMFDFKSVKAQEDLLRSLNQHFAQAQEAEKAGNKAKAKELLLQILKEKPNYRPAQELLQKLDPKPVATPAAAASNEVL